MSIQAVLNFFSNLLSKFRGNNRIYNSLVYVEGLIPKIGPFIKIAGDIIVGLVPTEVDDAAWAIIKGKYPHLFDGSKLNQDTLKLYALGITTDLVQYHFPEASTTVARTATQLAYLIQKNK